LADEKDLTRLHIVLDASKAKRCEWCGSPQSDRWLNNEEGTFCSNRCSKAAGSENRWMTALISVFSASFFIWAWIWILFGHFWVPPNFMVMLLGLTFFFVVPISVKAIIEFANHKSALEIPRGSRRNIGVSKVSLLRMVSDPIECPNCDGNIDLRSIGEDMVYTCQYCGANGVIDIKIQS